MTHDIREVEEAAKDWLFAGDEPKPEDEIVYKEFVDFLANFLHHQLQKAREFCVHPINVAKQIREARQDWLREEIVRLEEIQSNIDNFDYDSDERGKREILQTIIDRYQEELDQDNK